MLGEGRYTKGEPLIREALEIRRKLYGTAHPDVARSLEELGLNYFERGENDEAVQQLREAVAMQRKLHGKLHPALAQAMDNLPSR